MKKDKEGNCKSFKKKLIQILAGPINLISRMQKIEYYYEKINKSKNFPIKFDYVILISIYNFMSLQCLNLNFQPFFSEK